MAMGTQKTIVVSNVHMSDGAAYSWFLTPAPERLVLMLKSVAEDPDVAELVLLGDIFDLWLYPLEVVPWSVQQIATAPVNQPVTQALQKCVEKLPNVYFIHGNHDMDATAADLQVLSCGGKDVHPVTPEEYSAKYADHRRLEHGHAADMFNAPCDPADALEGYPLGYFITRLVASAVKQADAWHNLRVVLPGFQERRAAAVFAAPADLRLTGPIGSELVKLIIGLLARHAGVNDTTPIRFADPRIDKKYTVGDIKNHYGSLYGTWLRRYPNPIDFLHTLLGSFVSNGLDWYAKKLLSNSHGLRLVVMGHTHHVESETPYDNDGCWCLSGAAGQPGGPSYVEIVDDTASLVYWSPSAQAALRALPFTAVASAEPALSGDKGPRISNRIELGELHGSEVEDSMPAKASRKYDVSKFILNCLPSPNTEKDWGVSAARAAGVHAAAEAAIPPSRDLREPWWTVGNQGGTGSCVGWGTADGVLRWHFVKAGKISEKESLSVRYVWMSAKETDAYTARATSFIERDGTWLKAALDVARKFGVVTSAVLPFQNPAGTAELYTAGDENTFYALAAQRRIASYFNLGRNLADWRAWIANSGPVLTRLEVDTTWDQAAASHGNLDVYDAAHTRGGHCVALVGYTPGRFIVRNSWGGGWGDKGFAYASDKYAAAAFTEAYGVAL